MYINKEKFALSGFR